MSRSGSPGHPELPRFDFVLASDILYSGSFETLILLLDSLLAAHGSLLCVDPGRLRRCQESFQDLLSSRGWLVEASEPVCATELARERLGDQVVWVRKGARSVRQLLAADEPYTLLRVSRKGAE